MFIDVRNSIMQYTTKLNKEIRLYDLLDDTPISNTTKHFTEHFCHVFPTVSLGSVQPLSKMGIGIFIHQLESNAPVYKQVELYYPIVTTHSVPLPAG